MKKIILATAVAAMVIFAGRAFATDDMFENCIFKLGELQPNSSTPKLKAGDKAPDFTLLSISGEDVSLNQFIGQKNIVLSFIPAAWSSVCSEQWPEYAMTDSVFKEYDAVVIGVSVDNMPTLFAWTKQMGGFWFPVLSDFWPHGAVSELYGVLRSDGMAERALFVIDKEGIIRYIDVHDVNSLPDFAQLAIELQKLK